MGREVKRVALDFDWPLDKLWGGFINPFCSQCAKCPECESGYSPEAKALSDRWYGDTPFRPEDRGSKPFLYTDEAAQRFARRNAEHSPEYYGTGERAVTREATRLCSLWNGMWMHHLNADDVAALVAAHRLHDFTDIFVAGKGWQPKDPPYLPTPEEVNLWSIGGMGHDSINHWVVCKAELDRLGQPSECKRCHGSGELWPTPEIEAQSDAWSRTPPPPGEGWQVWETVSEGSPITPVFATRDALIDYLVEGGDGWDRKRGDGGWTRENAESFVTARWAPSLIGIGHELRAPRDGAVV